MFISELKQNKARPKAKAVMPFIDIGAVQGPDFSRMEVRLELGGGMVLTVARG